MKNKNNNPNKFKNTAHSGKNLLVKLAMEAKMLIKLYVSKNVLKKKMNMNISQRN
jgi:hypothetical protein